MIKRIHFFQPVLLLAIVVILPGYIAAQPVSSPDNCAALLHTVSSFFKTENIEISKADAHCSNNQLSINLESRDKVVSLNVPAADNKVAEIYPFYGLANYYNSVKFLQLTPANIYNLSDSEAWVSVTGRFKANLYNAPGAKVEIDTDTLRFTWPQNTTINLNVVSAFKSDLIQLNPLLDSVRYNHLWGWMASLSRAVEWSLIKIHTYFTNNLGLVIIIFAVFIKLFLLPVSILTTRLQRSVSQCQAVLNPQIAKIKARHKGEEAHDRIMAVYKAQGISPFYALKPLLGTLIQLPVFIAIFNALGEMHQFSGQSFLWISDLAYPDSIMSLPFAVPMLGESLNLLPILMTVVTIIATLIFQDSHAPEIELTRQKRNLYLMSFAFLVLFYPFPAVMVLYWTLSNLLHIVQQQIFKI